MDSSSSLLSTKDEVLDYLTTLSTAFDGHGMERYTAKDISYQLSITRNLASQYLNELAKEDKVIKVLSRPVYFIYRKALEQRYRQKLNLSEFKSVEQLMETLENRSLMKRNFAKLVGNHSSLSYCVEQCKAAMRYPPDGLPILLNGATGTGKAYLTRLMYEYALENNCIPSNSLLITINCGEYAEKGEEFLNQVRQSGTEGWMAKALGGLLFFDMVHLLPMQTRRELFQILDDHATQLRADKLPVCKLVFSASVEQLECLSKTFIRRIPIILTLPALEERSMEEKSEYVLTFLQEESIKLGHEIAMSHQAFSAFLNYRYDENLSQLRRVVRISCANALLHHDAQQEQLELMLYHLPEELIVAYRLEAADSEESCEFILPERMLNDRSQDRTILFFDKIVQALGQYNNGKSDFLQLMNAWFEVLYQYDEFLAFDCKYMNIKLKAFGQVVEQVLTLIAQRYTVQIPANCAFMLTRNIYNLTRAQTSVGDWECRNKELLEQCIKAIQEQLPEVHMVAGEAVRLLGQNLNLPISRISQIILMIYIHQANPRVFINDTVGMIISHGYSTASSIAHTANQLLHNQVFVPFDMPLSTPQSEIVLCIRRYVQSQNFLQNLIILVDMGSLEELDTGLNDLKNINIGIINNTTTKLALDIGSGILQKYPLEQILREACSRSICTYKTMNNFRQTDTIIFTSESGGIAAQRMLQLFKNSLPCKIDVDIITYDFQSLSSNLEQDDIFKSRNVLFISGVLNPGIEGVPFIPVENIIGLMETKSVRRLFSRYLTAPELEVFNTNLLKNFSLQNVVKSLTILDADRLLDFVEEAVKKLQYTMHCTFSAKTIVGLYIHISCMIERLVTKSPMEDYRNLAAFMQEQRIFISRVQDSFATVCTHYHVELPNSEIGYIYDYISNDHPDIPALMADSGDF